MIIQWYPGHMNKALKAMENDIKIVDTIIYVLDSRAPFSCVNPKFTEIVKDIMENTIKLDVPLEVDIQFGINWYEAK